ncbi:Ntn hydrolase family protein [Neisseria weaveri]|uniref:MFS transporter n=1 Tax=Neisseria weaveri TaxID=28091 RepID=UPI00055F6897|nr:MFS transporter [Neisseria weaveri]SAY50232.1 ATP-dependent protease subunit HslV [Neisseria weaveri]
MTTIVIVEKQNRIAIAADSQTTFGDDQFLGAENDAFSEKIFRHADSFIAVSGSTAHDLVLKSALKNVKAADLYGREAIFHTFCKLHAKLKEHFFLRPEEEEDDPYESSQMMVVIANPSGIFGVYPMREVYQFKRFWAIGSGRKYAMGALQVLYGQEQYDAEALAVAAVEAGAAFDISTSLPVQLLATERKI